MSKNKDRPENNLNPYETSRKRTGGHSPPSRVKKKSGETLAIKQSEKYHSEHTFSGVVVDNYDFAANPQYTHYLAQRVIKALHNQFAQKQYRFEGSPSEQRREMRLHNQRGVFVFEELLRRNQILGPITYT